MARAISQDFLNDLLTGELKPLLDIVYIDDTLDLELRGEYINIYYRGGSLFKIEEKENRHYKISLDKNYCNTHSMEKEVTPTPSINEAVRDLPLYKQAMDIHLGKSHKYEREFQQVLVRENNCHGIISRSTDYYIIDIEYADSKENRKSRFDIVALKWESNPSVRKKPEKCSIALMELKYGDGALNKKSGIKEHLNDLKSFMSMGKEGLDDFKKDIETVFKQKCQLGLVDGLQEKQYEVSISFENPEVIFLFANHDPDSSVLVEELAGINYNDYKDIFDIYIAEASYIGYGLYAPRMKELSIFQRENCYVYDC